MKDDMTMHFCERCHGLRKAKYAPSQSISDCLICLPLPRHISMAFIAMVEHRKKTGAMQTRMIQALEEQNRILKKALVLNANT